jgi:calcium-dependent protein kinase
MGIITCCQLKENQKILGQVIIDLKPEIIMDQYGNNEYKTKTGTGDNCSSKKKESIHFDKKDFVRMKDDDIFDEYDLKDKLGEGAYGCVYKVQQKTTNFLRAIKAIKKKNVDHNEFNNEIEVLKAIDHPNIIKLFDCYQDKRYYYMVEEFCSGGDLFDYIQKEKFFTEKKAGSIFNQLLSAVNHLHKKNIVHRDLKPENIVLIETNNKEVFIKLIDFGTSITIKGKNLTEELGTIYYIAPEVFMNNYNEKADIWSCGIILYTMLCGHPPFCGSKENVIKSKILHSKLEFPSKEFKNVSQGAINYIKDLLSYNPDKRPTAEEALNNKWLISINHHGNQKLSEYIITNLIKFRSTVGLQKATVSFLTNQISINEEIKKLKEEFDKIDVNKDGEISKDELVRCLEVLYPSQEAKLRAEEIFKEIDFNDDGSINFSEFLTVNIKKEKLLNEETLNNAFKMFDIDGNGYITIDELKKTMPLEITSKTGWKELVSEVDHDGDYQIFFEEFKEMMEKLIN